MKMKTSHFSANYKEHTKELLNTHGESDAMALAVGGDFEAAGLLEFFLLLQNGLQKEHTVVDVGCGSGRLAFQLRDYLEGLYVGIDVVPDLFQYAEQITNRPEWKFYSAPGLVIPEADESADFICFFSVFTHLLHEESFQYLEDAKRVIKPGGRIIFSFLEFSIPSHWTVFENTVLDRTPDKVLNQFLGRDAIDAWGTHLGLKIVEINDGDKPHIPLNRVVRWNDGREMVDTGNLGQSICVLTKE